MTIRDTAGRLAGMAWFTDVDADDTSRAIEAALIEADRAARLECAALCDAMSDERSRQLDCLRASGTPGSRSLVQAKCSEAARCADDIRATIDRGQG